MGIVIPTEFQAERPVSQAISADDTAVAARIWCINPAFADPQVVLTTGSSAKIDFYSNYNGGSDSVKDSGIGTAGVVSILTAAYGTIKKLVDLINASASWRAVAVAALPGDALDVTNTTQVIAMAADGTNAKACSSTTGSALLWDTSVVKHHSACIGAEAMEDALPWYAKRSDKSSLAFKDVDEWDANGGRVVQPRDWMAVLQLMVTTATTIVANSLKVYRVRQDTAAGAQVEVYSGPGATDGATVSVTPDLVFGNPGERLVVRYSGTTFTSCTLKAYGTLGTKRC